MLECPGHASLAWRVSRHFPSDRFPVRLVVLLKHHLREYTPPVCPPFCRLEDLRLRWDRRRALIWRNRGRIRWMDGPAADDLPPPGLSSPASARFADAPLQITPWVGLSEHKGGRTPLYVPFPGLYGASLTISAQSQFSAHTNLNKNPAKLRPLDFAEKNGYIRGIVKEIIHDSGR